MTKHKCGLIIGRFQPLHYGHTRMIDKALERCAKVLVLIGSSQESHTEKNPFTYYERREWLEEFYMNDPRIIIAPLPDRGLGNNSSWGDYVLNYIKENNLPEPDVAITAYEERRENWFPSLEILEVPRTIQVCATEVREAFLNDSAVLMFVVPTCVEADREMIVNRLREARDNKEKESK